MALLYLWKTTKNLSKLQGWLVNILSQSHLFPEINKTIWLPWSLILNLSQVHQSWEKFWAMASILRTCFVKNIVARINSLGPISNRRSNSPSSGPCKVILFHPVVISSMRQEKEKCFQDPKERNPKPAATKATGRDKHVFSKKGQTLPQPRRSCRTQPSLATKKTCWCYFMVCLSCEV